jgi:PAS domain S-box-containing protein
VADLQEQIGILARELKEANERQTATADILKVIASSPSDVQPVFEAIAVSANRLMGGFSGAVFRFIDGIAHLAAFTPTTPEADDVLKKTFPMPVANLLTQQNVLNGETNQIADTEAGKEFQVRIARARGFRSIIATPLMHQGTAIGMISITRRETGRFAEHHVQLLRTFADQAVIAIENARLFDEVQAKSRDLEESLQQQTATSEVLEIISSSPADLAPVFDKVLENATHVCGAEFGSMVLVEDDSVRQAALYNAPAALAAARANKVFRLHPQGLIANAIRTKKAVQVADVRATTPYIERIPYAVEMAELGGARSLIVVPMLREDQVIGAITIYRQEVCPFAEKQIELVSNFAKQAAIAIENARLLRALRERTENLSKSLEQQTATADVLKIISRSSVELETVLDTLVDTVTRLCRADQAYMFRQQDDAYQTVAVHGLSAEAKEFIVAHPPTADRGSLTGRVALERRSVHIPDYLDDPEYTYTEAQRIAGFRTGLGIPLLRGETLIGIFTISRTRVEPFTKKEIELATTFADQAVIAIENARLFEELRDRQAELRVTFDNMGDGVVMFDAAGRLTAWNRNFQELIELPESFLAGRPTRAEYFRYLADRGEFVSADLEAQLGRTVDDTGLEMRYERTRPDGRIIEVRRNPVPDGGFVLIYADITERKRAEEAIRAARDAAEAALRELQIAQASLVHAQKMAALGQVTAGIAHEIKNPLNFVNNFAGLSVELLDELKDAAAQAVGVLDPTKRAEIVETIGMLTGNLEKIVEHGRRADGIVRSMLQHSRGGSGDWQATDLNALVEEALNLAYHGARSQDKDFNITLERDLDRDLAPVDVVPQEITRVLLNLIGNGFYAAHKRTVAGDGTYRPTLKVQTREFGDSFEVRVRDNGVGIPQENREKLFQPFFTTKPTGEGTGLGLSISYEIVTQQHGGTITVNSEVGDFTEFTVRLPRSRHALSGRSG